MKVYFIIIIYIFVLSCFGISSPLKFSIIQERNIIVPGKPVNVAFELKLQPGWKVNWKNPGDSGKAIEIKWTLAEGMKIEREEWTFPEIIELKEHTEYGYTQKALIVYRFSTTASTPKTANLKYKISWTAEKGDSSISSESEGELVYPKQGPEDNYEWYPFVHQFRPDFVINPQTDWKIEAIKAKDSLEIYLYPPERYIKYSLNLDSAKFISNMAGIFKAHGQRLYKLDKHYMLKVPLKNQKQEIKEIDGFLFSGREVWYPGSFEYLYIKAPVNKK